MKLFEVQSKYTITDDGQDKLDRAHLLLFDAFDLIESDSYHLINSYLQKAKYIEERRPQNKERWKQLINGMISTAFHTYMPAKEKIKEAYKILQDMSNNYNRYILVDGKPFKINDGHKVVDPIYQFATALHRISGWVDACHLELGPYKTLLEQFGHYTDQPHQPRLARDQDPWWNSYTFISGHPSGKNVSYTSLEMMFKKMEDNGGWYHTNRRKHLRAMDWLRTQAGMNPLITYDT